MFRTDLPAMPLKVKITIIKISATAIIIIIEHLVFTRHYSRNFREVTSNIVFILIVHMRKPGH